MRDDIRVWEPNRRPIRRRRWPLWAGVVALMLLVGLGTHKFYSRPTVEKTVNQLQFDGSVTEGEKEQITQAIKDQQISLDGDAVVSVSTTTDGQSDLSLNAYVPVTDYYASRQSVASTELKKQISGLPATAGEVEDATAGKITLLPADQLTDKVKLLALDGEYYLDSFTKGAVFRVAAFNNTDNQSRLDLSVKLNKLPGKDSVLKVNMTGVTALTRLMMTKLNSVRDPTYFSEKIGGFLKDADITHVSNEVSFRSGCQYSTTSFCSPPEFIETLKDSGVDLVELTGNHNNDQGSTYNTDSVKQYHDLGWHTFGGGLNSAEAAKPYVADQKGSTVTFIAYNLADGAGSGAIAGADYAGANIYSDAKAKTDIEAAKQSSQFVIVNIQYAECQAYPAGYVEYPICDGPIGGQREAFRKLIDFGADMVIGSSAHQPQTFELYNGKPIYYGLGNLYFDQTQWPGTERGIILTHYFVQGKLVQTKLSPTVYDEGFQTRLMSNDEAAMLLERLKAAR